MANPNNRIVGKFKGIQSENREIIFNVIGAFGVRGLAMIVSLFTMPVYIRFFNDQSVLGVWYTLLSIMNWVNYFDLALGNGLRNLLPKCLLESDTKSAKQYIASTYVSVMVLVIGFAILGNLLISIIDWNSFINISESLINGHLIKMVLRIVFLGAMIQFVFRLITSILYAMQKAAIVNLLSLFTSILTLFFVLISPNGNTEECLIRMAWINVAAMNIPYIIATIIVFAKKLKSYIPKISDFAIENTKQVLNIGVVILWLQIVFMIVYSTNEVLISHFAKSSDVVLYQAYNKIFNTISSLFSLALIPIWSAVTKAQAQSKFRWIKKLYKKLLWIAAAVGICELIMIPFLQDIVNVWLGSGYILIESTIAILFVASNVMFYIHNVNTSFGNGASFFKPQIIWMTFAALVNIPLAYFFVNIMGSWVGVILANILSLLPFEVIEVIAFNRYLSNFCAD